MKRRQLNPVLWFVVILVVGWAAALLSALFTMLPPLLLSLPFIATVVVGASVYLCGDRREKERAFHHELEQWIRHCEAQLEEITRLAARERNCERSSARYAT